MKLRHIGLLSFKLAITVGLLWLLTSKIDVRAVATQLGSIQVHWAAAALALLFGQLVLTGIRWHFVGRLVSAAIGARQSVRFALIGQFFSQVLPTSVGGDAVRAWLLRETVPLGRAIVSIVCDRLAAMVVLMSIVAVTVPLWFHAGLQVPVLEKLAVFVPAIAASGLVFLLLLGEKVSELLQKHKLLGPVGILIGNLRTVLFTSRESVFVVGLALLVQAIMVLAVLVCALAIGIQLGAVHALLLPLILLISMVPISFAGWGVRESSMVVGLGLAGTPASEALAISLLFGLTQILIGVPGGVLWLARNSAARTAVIRPEDSR